MNTFQCTNCGFQLQRPTQPYSCPQCGRQAITLFRLVGYTPPAQGGGWPAQPGVPPAQGPVWPAQPGVPPQGMPQGMPQQQQQPPAVWPAQPGAWPAQPQQPWPAQPAMPQQPGGWPAQQGMPQQQPPASWPMPPAQPQQPGGWPMPPAQQPAQPPAQWPAQPGVPAGPPSGRPYQPGSPPSAHGGYPPPQAPRRGRRQCRPRRRPHSTVNHALLARERRARARRTANPRRIVRPARCSARGQAALVSAGEAALGRAGRPSPPPAAPPAAAGPRKAAPSPPAEQGKRRPASAPPQAGQRGGGPAAAPPSKRAPVRRAPRVRPPRPEQFLWAFPDQPAPEDSATPLRTAPAVDRAGRIFVHTRGRLFGLREVDDKPTILWEYVTGKHVPGPLVIGPDDSVFLHATDGYLHCIDGASGKQNWPPACVGEPLGYAAPVVDDEGNTWISGYDGGILKVDADGHLQKPGPFFRSRQKFDSAAIMVGGVLYAAAESGYVYAIQADGERGVNLWNPAGDQGFAGWCIHSAPAMTDEGILVVPGHDDLLFGFAADGVPIFKTQMPGQVLGSPVLDRYGHIYVGVSQFPRGYEPRGLLVCLDGNSHKIRWEYRAAGAVESTPVIGDDDVIYFGDNAGEIHALDLLGNALWTAQVGSPVRSSGTIPAAGRVAFGLDDETIVVLRCSSAALAPDGWPKLGRTLGQNGTK